MENTINYKGLNIEITRDEGPENPFEAWDGNLPLISKYDRYTNDYSKGDINNYLAYILTDGQVLRHQKKIAEVLEIDLNYFKDYDFSKEDKISDIRSEIEGSKDFAVFETICILTKTPYLNTCSRGYSQGDYSEVFTCYTEEFKKVTGCEKKQIDDKRLKSNVDLYSAWAWGDVYCFFIEETGDSCCGFYGDDMDSNGLLEAAKDNIDYYLENKKKERFSKLKKLISSKVDLNIREKILIELS